MSVFMIRWWIGSCYPYIFRSTTNIKFISLSSHPRVLWQSPHISLHTRVLSRRYFNLKKSNSSFVIDKSLLFFFFVCHAPPKYDRFCTVNNGSSSWWWIVAVYLKLQLRYCKTSLWGRRIEKFLPKIVIRWHILYSGVRGSNLDQDSNTYICPCVKSYWYFNRSGLVSAASFQTQNFVLFKECSLIRGCAVARLLGLRVRIPPETWMPLLSIVCVAR